MGDSVRYSYSSSSTEDAISSSNHLDFGLRPEQLRTIRREVELRISTQPRHVPTRPTDPSPAQSSFDFYNYAVSKAGAVLEEAKEVLHLLHQNENVTSSELDDESTAASNHLQQFPSTSHRRRHSPPPAVHRQRPFEHLVQSVSPAPVEPVQSGRVNLDEVRSLIESANGIHQSVGGWKQEMARRQQNIMVRVTDAAELIQSVRSRSASSSSRGGGGRQSSAAQRDREKFVDSAMRGLAMEFQSNGMRPEESFIPLQEATNYIRQLERSNTEDKVLQPSIRPVRRPEPGCPPFKHDPVKRFEVYAAEWKKVPLPGENKHKNLRWQVREMMLTQDIPVLKNNRKTF